MAVVVRILNEKRKNIFFVAFIQKQKHFVRSAFVFGTMCSAPAERDAHFVRDVCFASDVRFAREDAEHITSLCAKGAIHHYGEAITSLRLAATALPAQLATSP